MSDAGDARLTFETLALRRELASDHCELAPVAAPQLAAYGSEAQTTAELQLALAELADEARPTTVARSCCRTGCGWRRSSWRSAARSCPAGSAARTR